MTLLATYFLAALGLSLVLTPVARSVARYLDFVVATREDRWHQRPTALLGGVTIALTVVGLGLTIAPRAALWPVIASGALIAAFGFLDDVMPLKASTKLIGQVVVASVLLFMGYRLGWTSSVFGDAMLTLFWIVGITNAFNLLDNMDGLAAGTAVVAGVFMLAGMLIGAPVTPAAIYLATLVGATAGFLVYNFHPASIFMGDTGSLFLGLNLAAITLLVDPSSSGGSGLLSVVLMPMLPLLIPIFDTTLVTTMRLLTGRRPSQGGRDHSSHRLVAIGLSEPRAVTILWMLSAASGIVSLVLQRAEPSLVVVVMPTFLIALVIFAVYLARIRVYEALDPTVLKRETITPLVVNFMYKRRVAEVLLDLCLIPLAYYGAYRLRFEGSLFADNYLMLIASLPVVLGVQLLALLIVGSYRGTWRYFGIMDTVVLAKAVLIGTVGTQIVLLYAYRFQAYSRSVFVIYAALLILLLVGTRASFRLLSEFVLRRQASGHRCVIYGTSGASLATIREAFGEAVAPKIVGFIDDDPGHQHMRIGGYSVVGDYGTLLAMLKRGDVDCVVLNTHLVDVDHLQTLEGACAQQQVDLLRLQVKLKPTSAAAS